MKRRNWISASLGAAGLAGLGGMGWLARSTDVAAAVALPGHERGAQAFGTRVTLKVLHADADTAALAMDEALAEIAAVDALMSLHRADSQLATLNRQGVLHQPDPRVLQVLAQAQALSAQTDGAFDVTVQPLWLAFSQAQARGELPSAAELAAARARVGWRGLKLQPQRVELARSGMAVTLNGLAQGYAADLALQALRARGVEHALLDSGEYTAIGGKGQGRPWVLGIKHPRQPDELAARLPLDGRALATSGDYETTFSADFVHHHIFDPASGDSPTALASATVLAPSGAQADGLSTAFMVMGAQRSLDLAAQLPGVDTLLIGKDGRRWHSAGWLELPA